MASSDFYEAQLAVLSVSCLIAVILERRASWKKQSDSDKVTLFDVARSVGNGGLAQGYTQKKAAASLALQYLIVYGIVMGADWLQGPYVYSLYREQYGYPERVVATLFVTGFLSAGLAAPLVGALADQHGRKRICLLFCITYSLTCVFMQFQYLPILFLGRLLGGISTSILFSVFESWLVSTSNALGLEQSELSSIFGRATLVNGLVAFSAGIFSNQLVGVYHDFATPFIASGIVLIIAWFAITALWSENYGNRDGTSLYSNQLSDPLQLKRLGQAWSIVRHDSTLLTLGLTQTCFEGSMYLFVFAWVPALQEASSPGDVLPLGYIFSAFMVSMMLGSVFYTVVSSTLADSQARDNLRVAERQDSSLMLHAKLSSYVCTVGALALAAGVVSTDVRYRFWAFCLFEACVGLYYPVQSMLRGTLISDDHRATLASLFRVPLNVFVFTTLMTGVSSARLYVFTGCALALTLSSIMTGLVIIPRAEKGSAIPPMRGA